MRGVGQHTGVRNQWWPGVSAYADTGVCASAERPGAGGCMRGGGCAGWGSPRRPCRAIALTRISPPPRPRLHPAPSRTVYFHLHGRLSEFPFTTLLRHGPCGAAAAPAAPAAAAAVGGDHGDGDGDCGGGGGSSSQVQVQGRQVQGRQVQPPQQQPPCPPSQQGPVVLVRLPYRAEPRSECGGPDSPYFLKVGVVGEKTAGVARDNGTLGKVRWMWETNAHRVQEGVRQDVPLRSHDLSPD